jgi:hypothetical protein
MTARDSLKDKIIIVAEHNVASSRLINSKLKNHGFSNIRHANTGESIYEILRSFYNQAEKIGLIVINQHLPHCQPVNMQQSLCLAAEATVISFISLCDARVDGLTCNGIQIKLSTTLTYRTD